MVDSNASRRPKHVSSSALAYDESIGQSLDEYVIAGIKRRSNDIFLIDALTKEKLRSNELLEKSYRLATSLQNLGCNKNTIVGLYSPNQLAVPIVILGTMMSGAILNVISPGNTVDEAQPLLYITKPSILFCSIEFYEKMTQILPSSCKIFLIDSNGAIEGINRYQTYTQLMESASSKPYTKVENKPDDTVFIVYSSGTTGLLKGVMLTHRNFLSFFQLRQSELISESEGPTNVTIGSLSHLSGLRIMLKHIIDDRTLIVMRKIDLRLFLSVIQEYKINLLITSPTVVRLLLKSPLVDQYDLSSVDSVICGSDSLSSETEQAFKHKFRLKYVQQMYGLTEALLCTVKDPKNPKSGTCGSALPGVEIKVVDTRTGETLKENESGEILVKGPNIMKGYYMNEEATAQVFDKDGWLHTGDVGYYDQDGDFFIVDRIKDIFKCGGCQVAPALIESLLLTHPAIIDCGVVGVPDEIVGEIPRAYVVRKVGTEVTDKEIIQYIEGRVSHEKTLRGGVKFIAQIPRNSQGKILRRKLREM